MKKTCNKNKNSSLCSAIKTALGAYICIVFAAHAEEVSNGNIEALLKAVNEQAERLNAQEAALQKQEAEIAKQKETLAKEKERFNRIKQQVSSTTGRTVATPVHPPASESAGAESAQVSPSAGGDAGEYANDVPEVVGVRHKQDAEKPPEIAAYVEEGGVLLRRGKFVVTPALEYQNSSATRVDINGFSIIPALNIGNFEITRVKRDTLIPSLSFRYGVTNRFEVDAKVPYVWRSDKTTARAIGVPGAQENTSDIEGHDIGDVEFGAHYQINDGKEGWPYLVGNLRVKTITGESPFDVPTAASGLTPELPTGTGFYAVQPSLTMIYPSDPVVYYSNIGYLYNIKRDMGGAFGTLDPGDAISASFGMSLALNDYASISLGYSHNTVFKTKQRGSTVPNSTMLQVGSLDLGYSYALSERTNLNFTVSAGVTDDAPDVRLIMRIPFTFDLL